MKPDMSKCINMEEYNILMTQWMIENSIVNNLPDVITDTGIKVSTTMMKESDPKGYSWQVVLTHPNRDHKASFMDSENTYQLSFTYLEEEAYYEYKKVIDFLNGEKYTSLYDSIEEFRALKGDLYE